MLARVATKSVTIQTCSGPKHCCGASGIGKRVSSCARIYFFGEGSREDASLAVNRAGPPTVLKFLHNGNNIALFKVELVLEESTIELYSKKR